MTTQFQIPADAVARLHILNAPPVAGFPFALVIARPPLKAVPESLKAKGQVSGLLTVDRGLTTPNAKGRALAAAVLEQGGPVGILFADLSNALACKRRMNDGRDITR